MSWSSRLSSSIEGSISAQRTSQCGLPRPALNCSGRLKLGASDTPAIYLMSTYFSEFQKMYPENGLRFESQMELGAIKTIKEAQAIMPS